MPQIEAGKVYRINYDGKVKLDAKVFKVYQEGSIQMVEWGVTAGFIVEPLERFYSHLRAATR